MIRNREVASLLEKIADLLEARNDSTYRIGAYRSAARQIVSLDQDIVEIWQAGKLAEIPGVGESIARKIDEYLRTGRLAYLENLLKSAAPGQTDLLAVPGLGPRRVQILQQRLGITSLAALDKAAREHRLESVPGFGPKLEANLSREVERLTQRTRRMPLGVAWPAADEIVGLLRSNPVVRRAEAAGSIRRRRDTIGDIDILVAADEPEAAVGVFTHLPVVQEILAQGPTRASILTRGDLQIDLRAIRPEVYGSALQYFTGSKEHNIALREIAMRKGLKLSEYGLFDEQTGHRLASASEEEVYAALGLPYIPPEIRENRGEIAAAQAGRLPHLIEEMDLRGDLQVHTNWSDGTDSLDAIVQAAKERGYAYVAITDHSRGLGIAHGLTVERVRAQRREIDALNARMAPFRVLHGIEVNVRRDGSLDYPDDVLREFDLVAVAVHSSFDLSEAAMTARILRALKNPWVDLLCHPRGRILGKRDGYALDLDAVIQTARDRGTALEIDSQPERLDLDDLTAQQARDAGATLTIDSDAHAVSQLALTRYGIVTARRGWIEAADVLNTLPLDALLRRLANRKAEAAKQRNRRLSA